MDNYIVYMHINKTNRKKYIGITCNRPCIRWHRGGGYRDQKRFYNAIKCYGWDGFEHIILRQGLSKIEAEKEEEFLIAKYESNDMQYGYNIENGGIIHKLSEEQKSIYQKFIRAKNIPRKQLKKCVKAQKDMVLNGCLEKSTQKRLSKK